MLKPKIFYRQLDSTLAKIDKEKRGKNFLISILSELESRFGETLHIKNGHIFERRGDEFILIESFKNYKNIKITRRLPVHDEAVRLVIKHGSFIYDNPYLASHFKLDTELGYVIPAAIFVRSTEKQWLFVFELKEGWTRDETILFLNAVRTALNYRLFSEVLKSELEQAAQIQKSLLPRQAPKVEGYEIFGLSKPAEIVGGDFYDYFQFDEENFGVSLGDASGHGLPAALLVRDVVIGLRMGLAKEMRLIHTVKKLNQVIQRSTYPTSFVSLFVGEVEYEGHFFYVNAGHPPPFLITDNEIVDLGATGIAMGFLPEIFLHRGYVNIPVNSVLVIYSDGIIERQGARGEQFGVDRLKELVAENRDKTAREMNKLIFKQVYDFGKRKNWEDDATVVVIKRLKNS